jgi:dihydroorotate dehydrogenase electron transfer subunit
MIYNLPAAIVSRKSTREGYIITLKIARLISPLPGQFLHLRIDQKKYDPLLRRPFSVWNYVHKNGATLIDVLFKIVGRGTDILSKKDDLDPSVVIPLGNSFNVPDRKDSYVMVAGGAGIVPFYLLGKKLMDFKRGKIVLIFGARTSAQLYGLEELKQLGMDIHTCTEDGSEGNKGLVTDILDQFLSGADAEKTQVFSCGPMPMMRRVAEVSKKWQTDCQLSLETHMGCALGACRACVVRIKNGSDWKYSRICCEGPNYDSSELIWE